MNYHSTKGQFTEDALEKAILSLFVEERYTYVHGEKIHRKHDEILFEDDLKSFLRAKYKNEKLTNNEIKTIRRYVQRRI